MLDLVGHFWHVSVRGLQSAYRHTLGRLHHIYGRLQSKAWIMFTSVALARPAPEGQADSSRRSHPV